MEELTQIKNVTLYPNDIDIVQEVAGMYSQTFSGALRIIIRDWARNSAAPKEPDDVSRERVRQVIKDRS